MIPTLVVLLALPADVGASDTTRLLAPSAVAAEVQTPAATAPGQAAAGPADEAELDDAAASTILAPEIEAELRRRHAEARASSGIHTDALDWDAGLTRLARSHAVTMAWQLGELVHRRRSLDERISHDWFRQLWRCAIGSVGENLAWHLPGDSAPHDSQSIADELFLQWMNSPSHRSNVMNPRHDTIGVGVVVGPDGRFWAVTYLADFDQQTHCPDGGADLLSEPSWSMPVAGGPNTQLVNVTLSVGSTGIDTADQTALVVKLSPWARVVAASTDTGDWSPSSNGRAGLWSAGDLDDQPTTLRITIEMPRGVRPASAIKDFVLTSDWGGATPVEIRPAIASGHGR